MPFQPGNKLAKGGARPNSGPKSYAEYKEIVTAADKARKWLEGSVRDIVDSYLSFVKQDPATARHAIDKIIPPVKNELPDQSVKQIIFAQFNNNTLQLPAETVPVTVLASDGDGEDKERGNGVAPPIGEGQDSPKFLHFKNVPRK